MIGLCGVPKSAEGYAESAKDVKRLMHIEGSQLNVVASLWISGNFNFCESSPNRPLRVARLTFQRIGNHGAAVPRLQQEPYNSHAKHARWQRILDDLG